MLIDWLIFLWGLLIVTTGKGITTEMSYSDACKLVTFFLEIHIVTTGNVFLFLPMIQTRKNIKSLGNLIYTRTNQKASSFNDLSTAKQMDKPSGTLQRYHVILFFYSKNIFIIIMDM
jgi:hypothetical protein